MRELSCVGTGWMRSQRTRPLLLAWMSDVRSQPDLPCMLCTSTLPTLLCRTAGGSYCPSNDWLPVAPAHSSALPCVAVQDGESFTLPIDDVDLLTYSVAVGSIVDVSLKGEFWS